MNNSNHNHKLPCHRENDPVRKSLRNNPPDLEPPMPEPIQKRVFDEPIDSGPDFARELGPQTRARFSYQIAPSSMSASTLGPGQQTPAHWPYRCTKRALTSSQGIAESGLAACSAKRCSMSAFSSCVNSPPSNQPLCSSIILSRTSRSSPGESLGSSARISALTHCDILPDYDHVGKFSHDTPSSLQASPSLLRRVRQTQRGSRCCGQYSVQPGAELV